MQVTGLHTRHTHAFHNKPKGRLNQKWVHVHNGYLSQSIQRRQFTDAKHERNELYARNEGIGALPCS